MEIVKLGKSGQISVPRAMLRRLGIEGEGVLLAELTDDGGILLRPAGVYPVEVYSDERLAEFADEDRPTTAETTAIERKRKRVR